jgi:hypothetical protein
LETSAGLQSVQFVDSGGIRIHYSTSSRDVISQNRDSAAYRNYTEDNRAMPYDTVSVPAYGNAKFTMDDSHDRIIFSFPFYDSMDIYRGTALFTLSVRALAEKLIAEGRLKPNDDISVIRIPPGIVFGSPDASKKDMLDKVSSVWNSGIKEHITLDAEDSGVKFALISTKTERDLFFGRLINSSVFAIPESMRIIFQLSLFLTFYLTLFFLINFRPNPITLVRNRIKNLRTNLFEQLYVKKSNQDRAKWILELEQRRDEIRAELKHKVKMKNGHEKTIDSMIDKAWDELLAVIKSGSGYAGQTGKQEATPSAGAESKVSEQLEEIEEAEELEEIEEIEEVEEAEELEEVEEALEAEEPSVTEETGEVQEPAVVEETGETEETLELDETWEDEEFAVIEETLEAEEPSVTEETGEVEEPAVIEEAVEVQEPSVIEEAKVVPPVRAAKGLLKLASKIEETEAVAETSAAVESVKTEEIERAEKPEEIEELEEIPDEIEKTDEMEASAPASLPSSVSKGLLALASREKIKAEAEGEDENEARTETEARRKGLLAMASEIEFDRNYPVSTDDGEDLNTELDIVSPFSSMFLTLDEDSEKDI